MFDFDTECHTVTPDTAELLTAAGLDTRAVLTALADDRTRRCPDGPVRTDKSWREAREG